MKLGQLQRSHAPAPQIGAGASARPGIPAMTEINRFACRAPHDGHDAESACPIVKRRSKRVSHASQTYS
jgi:hypothetical protein